MVQTFGEVIASSEGSSVRGRIVPLGVLLGEGRDLLPGLGQLIRLSVFDALALLLVERDVAVDRFPLLPFANFDAFLPELLDPLVCSLNALGPADGELFPEAEVSVAQNVVPQFLCQRDHSLSLSLSLFLRITQ